MNLCPFCNSDEALLRNDLAYARFDKYPVNAGHLLILPVRHVATWFAASPQEKWALLALVEEGKALPARIQQLDPQSSEFADR